ncbi:uncharacterized protein LOC120903982 isoform X2 [Anopheles arabiensis]|uniref:uncharacterized protein LOC120903982 isoform X2 n=1 Tax=Anopheles arabiensis TaxID=7173 RepID=UPI001AACD336|nr:uncharacterized protein LOC120903982 isoform X2 [Anopheles arabiensis]
MDSAKRPKLLVSIKNGEYKLLPLNNNMSIHTGSQNMARENASSSKQTVSSDKRKPVSRTNNAMVDNVPSTSMVVRSSLDHFSFMETTASTSGACQRKPKPLSSTASMATQTDFSSGQNVGLDAILEKLDTMQREQQRQADMYHKKMLDMEKQQKLIRAQLDILSDKLIPRPGFVAESSFEWETVGTREELDRLEEKLGEPEFKKKIMEFLDTKLPTDSSEARLHDSMDIIFKKGFVTQANWTGLGPDKVCFSNYERVIQIFKFIATCHGVSPTDQRIKTFFQNKFKHSKQRLSMVGKVKTVPHRRKV